MTEETFSVGDTVYLKSGGFPMSLSKIEVNDLMTVVYGKSSELRWATIPKAVLTRDKPRVKQEQDELWRQAQRAKKDSDD